MEVSENSGLSPQFIHYNRLFHYKPSILGYPYFWKHPNPLNPLNLTIMHAFTPSDDHPSSAALILKACEKTAWKFWKWNASQQKSGGFCWHKKEWFGWVLFLSVRDLPFWNRGGSGLVKLGQPTSQQTNHKRKNEGFAHPTSRAWYLRNFNNAKRHAQGYTPWNLYIQPLKISHPKTESSLPTINIQVLC